MIKTSVAVLSARPTSFAFAAAGTSILLAALLLPHPAAGAPKITTGASCSSTWVNNEGAMDCFIKGEDESNAGVKHPHYVTCDPGGDIFCCVDNDAGAQNCVEALSSGHQTTAADRLRALLAAQRTHLKSVGHSPSFSTGPGRVTGPGRNGPP